MRKRIFADIGPAHQSRRLSAMTDPKEHLAEMGPPVYNGYRIKMKA